jgi:EmrB/QacA subfamily drug resistance transporter
MTTAAPARSTGKQSADSTRGIVLLFVGLMLSMLLASLSQTVLSTALPTIVGELNGVDHMLWVMTAFILASTIMMPVYGKLGDLIGRKGLMLAAISLFVIGSVAGALAVDMNWLIVGRVIQGLGGGGLMILSQAIIADVVPARERGKYMGIMGAVFAVSSVAGPLLGGWFTEGIGWRWTFWLNVPLGVLALLATIFFLHLPKGTHRRPKIDIAGMVTLAVTTTAFILVASWGGKDFEWSSPTIVALIVLTIASAVAFVLIERRSAEPIIPLHLFRRRNFNLTTAAGLLTGVAMFGAIGYLPTYLQMAFGVDATQAGLLMIPMMAGLLITSVLTGIVVSKTGRYKWMPIVGSLVVALGLFLLSTLRTDTPLWLLCLFIAVMGIGLGTSMQILVLIVQNTFPVREVGTATASNNYFRQIGASLGSAVVGSLFTSRLTSILSERLPAAPANGGSVSNSLTPASVAAMPEEVRSIITGAYNEALTPLFLYMVPLALIAFVLLLFVREDPLATSIQRDAPTESLGEGNLTVTSADATDESGDAAEARSLARSGRSG